MSPGQRDGCWVSRSWANRYTDLSPEAVNVLTALTVLDVADVGVAKLAVALDLDLAKVEAAVRELRDAEWIAARSANGGDVLVEDARIWLRFDAPEQPKSDDVVAIARRVLTAVETELRLGRRQQGDVGQWTVDHQDWVLTAIRAGARAELHSMAASVASAAWQVASHVADPEWRRQLARAGEDAAIDGREPVILVGLLNRSATLFEDAGDRATAEVQWVRVAKLAFEGGNHARIVASLNTLIEFYNRWGRRGPAVDALLELADAQREAGNEVGRAEALLRLGFLMLSAGRAETAENYLQTAENVLSLASRTTPDLVQPRMRALVLELWGRALWQTGHSILARRCFNKALRVLGDHDPVARTRVRGLLDTHADDPSLPDDMPQPDALPVPKLDDSDQER